MEINKNELDVYNLLLDEIDKSILVHLGKNARISSYDIAKHLNNLGYDVTDRTIRNRLKRLETSNVILGYSSILNPDIIQDKINRTVLLKFKYSMNASSLIKRLEKYCDESQFCTYAAKTTGDFDWVCHFVFDSVDQFELESNNFLNRFVELIQDYRSYESKIIKSMSYTIFDDYESKEKKFQVYKILNSLKKYNNLNDKLQFIVESIVKYFDAKFARLWILDKEQRNLVLKFSAGKYKNINGEFSIISIDENKIGPIVKTKKPTISNDIVNDKRIKYPDWARKEKLQYSDFIFSLINFYLYIVYTSLFQVKEFYCIK
jgi:DNA-binding Lrp family transcriptional regulator